MPPTTSLPTSPSAFPLQDNAAHPIPWPDNAGIRDLASHLLWGHQQTGNTFVDPPRERLIGGEPSDPDSAEQRWVIVVSVIACRITTFLSKPMKYTGLLIEFLLNFLSLNGGVFGLLFNLLHGKVEIPRRGSESFISAIGHLDGRIDLYHAESLIEQINGLVSISVPRNKILSLEIGHRALMDLCIMASKLAYENCEVVRNVVTQHWKMHFVDFFDCWNDFQKRRSTQVFMFCDKPQDATLIWISFRGTEPFDAYNWCSDFDYSSYRLPKVGNIHTGFLEALGLGNRVKPATFQLFLQSNGTDLDNEDVIHAGAFIPPEMVKKTAYYKVRRALIKLLREHKNAKFVVTGHSLGGALAILFPCVLVLHEENELLQRLLGVYTFGQPRIGDKELAKYMEPHLERPIPKYFRVVYCNDVVPRLPFDDKNFLYKHFGECLYYNSCYIEQEMGEEPDKNFFGLRHIIPLHLNAVWELMRSLVMGYLYGPEYKEGWFSIFARVIGIALPGIAAHCPTDYVNLVRLGWERAAKNPAF